MKSYFLAAFTMALLSAVAFGIVSEEEITPENVADVAKRAYKLTIEGTKAEGVVYFKIKIEPGWQKEMPKDTSTAAWVLVQDGEKIIALIPVELVRKEKVVEVRDFRISAEYVAKSRFDFEMGPIPNPGGGAVFWCNLGSFIKP